jgi:hypothetical protein
MESSTGDSSGAYAPSYSNRDPGMNVPGKTCFLYEAMAQFACSLAENAHGYCFMIYIKHLPLKTTAKNYSTLIVCIFFSTLETKSGTAFSISELRSCILATKSTRVHFPRRGITTKGPFRTCLFTDWCVVYGWCCYWWYRWFI